MGRGAGHGTDTLWCLSRLSRYPLRKKRDIRDIVPFVPSCPAPQICIAFPDPIALDRHGRRRERPQLTFVKSAHLGIRTAGIGTQ